MNIDLVVRCKRKNGNQASNFLLSTPSATLQWSHFVAVFFCVLFACLLLLRKKRKRTQFRGILRLNFPSELFQLFLFSPKSMKLCTLYFSVTHSHAMRNIYGEIARAGKRKKKWNWKTKCQPHLKGMPKEVHFDFQFIFSKDFKHSVG